ncbi:hypothetical protein HK104_001717 [Borealophlyctis nickersoniae]|nr:hypothetical protein HK104_001717 [Borealophlyctis nickersoniae]
MSEKKMNYQSRQGLSFKADVPNFLLKLQQAGASGKGASNRSIPDFTADDEDSGPDAPEKDDEKPQVVAGKGVTDGDVERFLGKEDESKKRSAPTGEEDNAGDDETKTNDDTEDGNLKFRKPKKIIETGGAEKKRKLDEKRKVALSGTKKIKNKKLLSFDDEEG